MLDGNRSVATKTGLIASVLVPFAAGWTMSTRRNHHGRSVRDEELFPTGFGSRSTGAEARPLLGDALPRISKIAHTPRVED